MAMIPGRAPLEALGRLLRPTGHTQFVRRGHRTPVDSNVTLTKKPITVKPLPLGADPLDVRAGKPILPVERMKIFSPEEWEDFISEWATSLSGYGSIDRGRCWRYGLRRHRHGRPVHRELLNS